LKNKIDKWLDYVLEKEKRLQPLADIYTDRVKNKRVSIKETAQMMKRHIQSKDPTPPVAWLHQKMFNSINPYDVVDELIRAIPDSWNEYHYPANLLLKLSMVYNPPKDRVKTREIKDHNKEHGRFNPQTKCINCLRPVHIYYKNSKKIPRRTEKNICQCSGGQRIRTDWDLERSAYRTDLNEKAAYKKKQAEKAERHKKRSA